MQRNNKGYIGRFLNDFILMFNIYFVVCPPHYHALTLSLSFLFLCVFFLSFTLSLTHTHNTAFFFPLYSHIRQQILALQMCSLASGFLVILYKWNQTQLAKKGTSTGKWCTISVSVYFLQFCLNNTSLLQLHLFSFRFRIP